MSDQTGPAGALEQKALEQALKRLRAHAHSRCPCGWCLLLAAYETERARAEAAEAKRDYFKEAATVQHNTLIGFMKAISELEADLARERQRAEGLAAILWGFMGGLNDGGPKTMILGRNLQATGYEAFVTADIVDQARAVLRGAEGAGE